MICPSVFLTVCNPVVRRRCTAGRRLNTYNRKAFWETVSVHFTITEGVFCFVLPFATSLIIYLSVKYNTHINSVYSTVKIWIKICLNAKYDGLS